MIELNSRPAFNYHGAAGWFCERCGGHVPDALADGLQRTTTQEHRCAHARLVVAALFLFIGGMVAGAASVLGFESNGGLGVFGAWLMLLLFGSPLVGVAAWWVDERVAYWVLLRSLGRRPP
jgi:hypothetical protein